MDVVHALGPAPVMFTGGGTPAKVAGLEGNAVRMSNPSSEYLNELSTFFAGAGGGTHMGSGNFTLAGFWRLTGTNSSVQDFINKWDSVPDNEFSLQYRTPAAAEPSDVVSFIWSETGTGFRRLNHVPTSGPQ